MPDALPALCLVVVRGRSMLPTLRDGDRLLVRAGRTAQQIARPGDLVVVELPGGRPVAVKRLRRQEGASWWVERDNPHEGVDSWQVGPLAPQALLGVVLARVWPRPARLRRAGPASTGGDAPRDATDPEPG